MNKQETARAQHDKIDFAKEAKLMREHTAKLIKNGEARQFLIKHGFATKSGKLTKRYGG